MDIELSTRLAHAWNGFMNKDPTGANTTYRVEYYGPSYSSRPDRPSFSRGNEKSIVTSVYNRIALDVSSIDFRHARLDVNGRYIEDMNSGLNRCLSIRANTDQSARAFIQDVVISMMDEGVVAIVPVETTADPTATGSYDVLSLRTAKVIEWKPQHVMVRIYNEWKGKYVDKIFPKSMVAIIENPLYAVVNERNSTVQRLIRKLNILDAIDEQSGSGKLDLIIQLPYTIKTDAKRKQAAERKKDIEVQLSESKFGIAYIDSTEHVTQLNRPVDNNLMKQIEYLTSLAYSQLGMTQSILDGTADEKTMLNYYNRTTEPIASAIADALDWAFLTATARTQMQSISIFRDPFKLVPVSEISEIADKFTRNEIMSSNEIRQVIGMKPSTDPGADELRNKNLSAPKGTVEPTPINVEKEKKEENQNGEV